MNALSLAVCRHCGTRFTPEATGDEFCCNGCAFVHHLILEDGLEQFYRLKAGKVTTPAKSTPFHARDFSWLLTMQQAAEALAASKDEDHSACLDLSVQGISCSGCVWLLERLFMRQSGAVRARVSAHPGRMSLHWQPGKCDLPAFADEARKFGYLLGDSPAEKRDTMGGRIGLCGAFAMNAMAFSLPRYFGMNPAHEFAGFFDLAAGASATLALLTGGLWFISRAWACLRNRVLHIDLPIALGIVLAYAGSVIGWLGNVPGLLYFDFVAVFTFLMLLGRRWQISAVERNRGRLLGQAPGAGEVVAADGTSLRWEKLAPGVDFSVKGGQIVPVTARVRDGWLTVSLESINGEPDPREIGAGGRVPSGALVVSRGLAELQAMESWQESLYRRLTSQEEAQAEHPFLSQVLQWAIVSVMVIGLAGAGSWLAAGAGWGKALQVFISVLVVSCPCALGVAIPLADDLAARRAEKLGVFVRRKEFWPRLRRIRTLVFDKTGTLTLESPVLMNPAVLTGLDEESRCALATLTSDSLHPVGRSLAEALGGTGGAEPEAAPIHETVGQGVWFVDAEGRAWSLGKRGWKDAACLEERNRADVVLACDGREVAAFQLRDALRPGAANEVAELSRRGFSMRLLSGDESGKVNALAASLGMDAEHAWGGLSPEAKEEKVRVWNANAPVLYLGDGMNDSLAFGAAACTGTPVADKGLLENRADFYFLSRGLRFLQPLFHLARTRKNAVRLTAAFAIAYNIVAVGLSLAGYMNPLLAAIFMPLSSLVTLGLTAAAFQADRNYGLPSQSSTYSSQSTASSSQSTASA